MGDDLDRAARVRRMIEMARAAHNGRMERWEMKEHESIRILTGDIADIIKTLYPRMVISCSPGTNFANFLKRNETRTFAERSEQAKKNASARWKGRKPVYCHLEGHNQVEQGETECPRAPRRLAAV